MPVLTYPLALSTFWGGLKIAQANLRLGGAVQSNETGGGEVIRATVGARLWEGDATLSPSQDPGAFEALLSTLEEAAFTFFATPSKRAFPIEDPGGAILGAAPVVIASLPAGGRSLTLSGLPSGYVLTAGDYLSFTRETPARYEFHRIVTPAVANGAGVTPEFDVTPGIRPGVVVGATVHLARPFFRAVLLPGSFKPGPITAGPSAGASFSFRQTLTKA